jgi:hypothetical protein
VYSFKDLSSITDLCGYIVIKSVGYIVIKSVAKSGLIVDAQERDFRRLVLQLDRSARVGQGFQRIALNRFVWVHDTP